MSGDPKLVCVSCMCRSMPNTSPGSILSKTPSTVGESGSGKSVTMMSVMRLIVDPNAVFSGQVMYKDRDLMGLSQAQMQGVCGRSRRSSRIRCRCESGVSDRLAAAAARTRM